MKKSLFFVIILILLMPIARADSMTISSTLSPSTTTPSSSVMVYGRMNMSNGTNVSHTGYYVYVNNTLQYENMTTFNGTSAKNVTFDVAGSNLSAWIKLPKLSHIISATMNLTGFSKDVISVWNYTQNPSSYEDGLGMLAIDSSDNIYSAGYVAGNTVDSDMILIRLNTTGSNIWNYTSDPGDYDYSVAAVVDSSGDVYIGGFEEISDPNYQWRAEKINASGVNIWNYTNNPGFIDDIVYGVTLSSSEDIYLSGYQDADGTNYYIRVEKINSTTGLGVWNYTNGPLSQLTAVGAFEYAGYVYVTGVDYEVGNYRWLVQKLNASDGTNTANYTSDPSEGGAARGGGISSDGNLIVGGYEFLPGVDSRWRVEKINTSSMLNIWNYTSNPGSGRDRVDGQVVIDSYDNIYAVGWDSVGTDYRLRAEKISPEGTNIWNYTSDPSSLNDTLTGIALDSLGYVYISGHDRINGATNSQLRIEKLTDGGFPDNPSLDLDENGIGDYNYSGYLSATTQTDDLSSAINNYLSSCSEDAEGFCYVPINITSQSGGTVELSSLDIQYVSKTNSTGHYNYTLTAPAAEGIYNITVNATYNQTTGENVTFLTVTDGYIITNLVENSTAVLYNNTETDVTTDEQLGIQQVLFGDSNGNYSAFAFIDFTNNIDLSNVLIDINLTQRKSVIVNLSSVSGVINMSLLVPRTGVDSLHVCHNATSLSEVNASCPNMTMLAYNTNVTNATINGVDYYVVSGITGSGGEEDSVYLNVTIILPPAGSSTSVSQNATFIVNASISCIGDTSEGRCEEINGTIRYNSSESNEANASIITLPGSEPFWALTNETCGVMVAGDNCSLQWTVNATGNITSEWFIDVNFTSNKSILSNDTADAIITIVNPLYITLQWSNLNFSSLIPGQYGDGTGNADRIYNITVEPGSCDTDLYIKGTDLEKNNTDWEIGAGNLTWNTTDSYPGFQMNTTYHLFEPGVSANTNITTYYWIDVPSVEYGDYRGYLWIKGACVGEQ